VRTEKRRKTRGGEIERDRLGTISVRACIYHGLEERKRKALRGVELMASVRMGDVARV